MRPSLDQLEALLWIARLGSFRRAAQRLNISQPAISGRIREMEEQLGFEVVDRSGHIPQLTSGGQETLRHAEQMIALAESFRGRIGRRNKPARTIRMGAADTFALTCLLALLERVAAVHPEAQVELEIDFSSKLDRKLQAGELDIAFLTSPSSHDSIYSEPLLDLDLGWIASPRTLLKQGRLRPADLLAVPIITNPRPSHLYKTILDWFAAGGCIPARVHTCTSLTIMTGLAMGGFGITVMPLILVHEELRSRRVLLLDTVEPLQSHYISLAYRTDRDKELLSAIAAMARAIVSERLVGGFRSHNSAIRVK
jgi:DNA-binding transcriptional LysR family regulator